jgi:hypothetical protein
VDEVIRDNKPGERWHSEGESFEHYVERQFVSLHERLDRMAPVEQEIAADVDTLAQVIPQLATDIGDLHTTVTEKETKLTEAIAAKTEDDAEKAALEAELKAIQGLKPQLDSIVQQAQSVVQPTGAGAPGAGTSAAAPGGTVAPGFGTSTAGAAPTGPGTSAGSSVAAAAAGPAAGEKPKYTYHGPDVTKVDSVVWIETTLVDSAGEKVWEFASDTPGGAPTGAEAGVWEVASPPFTDTAAVQGSSGQEAVAPPVAG